MGYTKWKRNASLVEVASDLAVDITRLARQNRNSDPKECLGIRRNRGDQIGLYRVCFQKEALPNMHFQAHS